MSFPVFLHLLVRGHEKHAGERRDGRIPVRRGHARNLLDEGGEEEEDIGVFAELFYAKCELRYAGESSDLPLRNLGTNETALYLVVLI